MKHTLPTAASLVVTLALAACGDGKSPSGDAGVTTASPAATAATPAQPGQDWRTVFAATPEGGFRMGNPDARVKLVEFASLTCPHCREFHEAAHEAIRDKYVASGNVSYEFRNFVLNGPDYAASILSRCQGPEAFFGLLDGFYRDQEGWVKPFMELTAAQQAELRNLSEDQAVARLAAMGRLDEYVRTRGIPKARVDQCLADSQGIKQIADLRAQATDKYKLTGTPAFIINETVQEGVFTWPDLEPRLQAALR